MLISGPILIIVDLQYATLFIEEPKVLVIVTEHILDQGGFYRDRCPLKLDLFNCLIDVLLILTRHSYLSFITGLS